MNQSTALDVLLLDLIHQWEAFMDEARRADSPSQYEQGFIEGFEAAFSEVRLLFAQVKGLPTHITSLPPSADDAELDFALLPENEVLDEPAWEYLYVRFEQTDDGHWHIRDINGIRQDDWQSMDSFNEAVQYLREQGGWRLTNFAKGIHVFRRAISP